MVAAVQDLFEALSSMGIAIEARGDHLCYRPRSAMTPDILAAVKSCKAELLEILQDLSPPPSDLGCSGPHGEFLTSAVSSARVDFADEYTTPTSKADREFDRFEHVAIPTPDGSGWFSLRRR